MDARQPQSEPADVENGPRGRGTAGDRRRRLRRDGGRQALKKADVDVTVIDRHNHLLFQPLIYQVAAGALPPAGRRAPRHMLKRQANATVLMAAVTDSTSTHRHVVLDRGERPAYDSLILACGERRPTSATTSGSEVTCGLKTLGDAVELRDRIFGPSRRPSARTKPPPGTSGSPSSSSAAARPASRSPASSRSSAPHHETRLQADRPARRAGDPARRRRAPGRGFSEPTSARWPRSWATSASRSASTRGSPDRRTRRDVRPARGPSGSHPTWMGGRRPSRRHRGGARARYRCRHGPGRAHRGQPRPDAARTP